MVLVLPIFIMCSLKNSDKLSSAHDYYLIQHRLLIRRQLLGIIYRSVHQVTCMWHVMSLITEMQETRGEGGGITEMQETRGGGGELDLSSHIGA